MKNDCAFKHILRDFRKYIFVTLFKSKPLSKGYAHWCDKKIKEKMVEFAKKTMKLP